MYIFTVITIDFPSFVYRQAGSKNELSEPQFLIRSIRHILHLSSLIYVFLNIYFIFFISHLSFHYPVNQSQRKNFFFSNRPVLTFFSSCLQIGLTAILLNHAAICWLNSILHCSVYDVLPYRPNAVRCSFYCL